MRSPQPLSPASAQRTWGAPTLPSASRPFYFSILLPLPLPLSLSISLFLASCGVNVFRTHNLKYYSGYRDHWIQSKEEETEQKNFGISLKTLSLTRSLSLLLRSRALLRSCCVQRRALSESMSKSMCQAMLALVPSHAGKVPNFVTSLD